LLDPQAGRANLLAAPSDPAAEPSAARENEQPAADGERGSDASDQHPVESCRRQLLRTVATGLRPPYGDPLTSGCHRHGCRGWP
jgi:hypothetical protein